MRDPEEVGRKSQEFKNSRFAAWMFVFFALIMGIAAYFNGPNFSFIVGIAVIDFDGQ